MATAVAAVSRYTTGFCGTRRHDACPELVRCTDTLTIVCTCTCHTTSSPAAGAGEALPPATELGRLTVAAALGAFA